LVIDAGGTKLRLYLKDSEGSSSVVENACRSNWSRDRLQELSNAARNLSSRPSTVTAFVAGLLTQEDQQEAVKWMQQLWHPARVEAWPDYVGPLYLAQNGAIALLAGTGCVVASKSADGYAKTGGWGPLIGDFGSGFDLGRKGLWSYACRNWENDLFEQSAKAIFRTEERTAIMAAAGKLENVDDVARLAEVMLQLAATGEPLATAAVQQTAADQARLIDSHCKRLNLPKTGELILYGSLVVKSDTMRDFLQQELKRLGASFSFTMLTEEKMLSRVASYALERDRL
jgi:N-acetylglucosamine kinase-like BadF-type ATPase